MIPSGSIRLLYFYDVAEEIRLEELRREQGAGAESSKPALRPQAPGYVKFAAPPVVTSIPAITLASGERAEARLSYYEYGVVGLELEIPFAFDWDQLVRLTVRSVSSPRNEELAQAAVRNAVKPCARHLIKPYEHWLSEDYCVVHVLQTPDVTSAELAAQHAHHIAQIVRAEAATFSPEEHAEIMSARISYYPNDLLVAGWSAAFVYDSQSGVEPTVELLKFANTQLLDFRHYDEVLSGILAGVYKRLEARRGPLMRWRLARDAEKLNTLLLDIRELTERMDNSIKFLSDMFDARLYRLAAARVGVPDYRKLVDEKLRIAGELYHFMVDQFQHARAFLLELTVVIILLIELYYFFQGRH